MKVFLGGTVNGSTWRDEVISNLKIDYFNPIVSTWSEEARLRENHEKETSDFLLFVLTPKMSGVYSIAEVVDASNKAPEKTILCILNTDDGKTWSEFLVKSINAVEKLVQSNGAHIFHSLDEVVGFLNQFGDGNTN